MSRRLAIDPATPDDVAADGGVSSALRRARRWGLGPDGRVDPGSVAQSGLAVAAALLDLDLEAVLDGSAHPNAVKDSIRAAFPAAPAIRRAMVLGVLRGY